MAEFNPFGKPLAEVRSDDLLALLQVQEGWYVEYKREANDTKSIAKTLSSFANTYGGWAFYGVVEASDGTRVAGAFPGIDKSALPALEVRLREAARTLINPSPHFDVHQVHGPNENLGLPANRSILLQRVPEGRNPPYVHGNGSIYRRVADSSVPLPADRSQLDLLWGKGQQERARLDRFLASRPARSEAEESNSYLHLFLMPDPLDEMGYSSRLNYEAFVHLMMGGPDERLSLQFDNVFRAGDGFVARQARGNDPESLILTWRYYANCASRITIPLMVAEAGSSSQLLTISLSLRGYEYSVQFAELCLAKRLIHGRVIDGNNLSILIALLLDKQLSLLRAEGLSGTLFAKASLEGIWRCVPFLDTKSFMTLAEKRGLPVVQDTETSVPHGTGLESLWRIEAPSTLATQDSNEDVATAFLLSKPILMGCLGALGVPETVLLESMEELVRAGIRAVTN